MCHICAKGSLNLVVIDKNVNFSRNCPKFDICPTHKNAILLEYFNRERPTPSALSINFVAGTYSFSRKSTCNFDSCDSLNLLVILTVVSR